MLQQVTAEVQPRLAAQVNTAISLDRTLDFLLDTDIRLTFLNETVKRTPRNSLDGINNEARERSEPFFLGFPRKKSLFITGRTSRGCQKKKNQTLFCTVRGMFVYVCDATS